ncbi:hypothetical protein GO755_36880 [Spirosoma sp. HMF4905]|uniref:Uncharacterized protein n=1 Tax=Spirosoma arboris TaxID=2682092 RepID=A0A7K1SPC6_9BACT|nr:hypothetical protein [Spirosoma arboris]MVM35649.1 hypothetical protein [Spirosoma arboris]
MRVLAIIISIFFCFSCEKNDVFQSETDEHFSILKEEIESMPEIPVNFYWESQDRSQFTTPPVTTCLTSEVRFEKPYIIANGVKFHAYYWTRTENKIDASNRTIISMIMAFNKEN